MSDGAKDQASPTPQQLEARRQQAETVIDRIYKILRKDQLSHDDLKYAGKMLDTLPEGTTGWREAERLVRSLNKRLAAQELSKRPRWTLRAKPD